MVNLLSERGLQICCVSNKNPKVLAPSKTCNMPYISVTALRILNSNQKILPPQHIVVNTFPDYPFQKNSTCIKLNPDNKAKKLRLATQTLNILRFKITYFNQIIQNQENVKND